MTTRALRDVVRELANLIDGVGGREAQASDFEQGVIRQVIAKRGDLLRLESARFDELSRMMRVDV